MRKKKLFIRDSIKILKRTNFEMELESRYGQIMIKTVEGKTHEKIGAQ